MKYEIFTDSSCDLTDEIIEKFNLHVMQLEVIIDDNPPVLNNQLNIKEFYSVLKTGANVKTAAVTPGFFEEKMKECLSEGKDILYLGFSSGLSATYNNGVMIMQELQDEFPERKLLHVDTLAASMGQGLLVYYAALLRESGAEIEDVQKKIESIRLNVQHQITVDNLFFLKKGGRIDAATAIAGSMLNFKPIINTDENGKLVNVAKVRGRKASLNELFTRMKENQNLEEFGYVFISHCDCFDDANKLATMVKEELNPKEVIIGDIGPVIGAHLGPGGMALCYMGK